MAAMLEFRIRGFSPYAVKYSPYYDSRIAVATAANFGIIGNGRLFALELTPHGIQVHKMSEASLFHPLAAIPADQSQSFDTNDALYDLAWSEINENQLLVACGDGSLKLFDLAVSEFPVMNFHEHKREAFAVCWNPVSKDSFLSSSWDGTIKIWSPTHNQSISTLLTGSCTYSASYCPSNPSLISAASSDSQLRLFDLRTPPSLKHHLVATICVHASNSTAQPAEILTHDWNKYCHSIVATGGVDCLLRTFDIRNPAGPPLATMPGHEYAVRRLAWSPHASDVLMSASYDMSVRLWRIGSVPTQSALPHQMGLMNRHTEFVTGVDWCLFGAGGWVASAAWDERVLLWDANVLMGQ